MSLADLSRIKYPENPIVKKNKYNTESIKVI